MVLRPDLPEDEIVRLYISGESVNSLASIFKTDRGTINRRLLERGIVARGRSRAERLKWIRMTPDQRARQVTAAHDAVRGTKQTKKHLVNRAKGREKAQTHIPPTEQRLVNALKKAGFNVRQQTAVGPYNCDLTINTVAVEVWGGHFHFYGAHIKRAEKRARYILSTGWDLYILPITQRDPLTETRVRDLVTYLQLRGSNPTAPREYRVVWRHGKWERSGTLDDDKFTFVPPFHGRRNPTTGQYERVAR